MVTLTGGMRGHQDCDGDQMRGEEEVIIITIKRARPRDVSRSEELSDPGGIIRLSDLSSPAVTRASRPGRPARSFVCLA